MKGNIINFKPKLLVAADENENFLADTIKLFERSKSGHMNPYAFSVPEKFSKNDYVRGADWWEEFVRECRDYYLYSDEVQAIANKASFIGARLPKNLTVIDLGPGSIEAVYKKTLPILQNLDTPKSYIAADIVERFAAGAADSVKQSFSNLDCDFIHTDFLYENFKYDFSSPALMMLFGGLLCNTPTYSNGITIDQSLNGFLSNLRQSLPKNGYFLVSQDTNNDQSSLMRAYNHPKLALYILSALHRIKRDLPTQGFYPEAFDFIVKFDSDDHVVRLSAKARFTFSFLLSDRSFSVQKGDEYCLVNSFKFPADYFTNIFNGAGFETIHSYGTKNQRIAIHLFKNT